MSKLSVSFSLYDGSVHVGTLQSMKDKCYIIERKNKTYTVPTYCVWERKEFHLHDTVLVQYGQGDKKVWSKGEIIRIDRPMNNEGSRNCVYTVKVGNEHFEIQREEDIHPIQEESVHGWTPQQGAFHADSDKVDQIDQDRKKSHMALMDSLKKVFDQSTKHYGLNSGQFAEEQRQIGPTIDTDDKGHIKVSTGTPDGHTGHAVFMPHEDGKHFNLKQVVYSDPLATPFTASDMRKGKFHKDEIADAVKSHLRYHYHELTKDRERTPRA